MVNTVWRRRRKKKISHLSKTWTTKGPNHMDKFCGKVLHVQHRLAGRYGREWPPPNFGIYINPIPIRADIGLYSPSCESYRHAWVSTYDRSRRDNQTTNNLLKCIIGRILGPNKWAVEANRLRACILFIIDVYRKDFTIVWMHLNDTKLCIRHFTTISGHFFANYMNIFHTT